MQLKVMIVDDSGVAGRKRAATLDKVAPRPARAGA